MLSKQYKQAQTNFVQGIDRLNTTEDQELNILRTLSSRIVELVEQQYDVVKLIEKFNNYCTQYERVIVQDELSIVQDDERMKNLDLCETLTIEDIVSLAASKDVNARTMGAVIFVDYALSRSDATFISEMIASGGIEAILESIQSEGNDHLIEELKFFATKALSDLCWAPNHFEIRSFIVQNEAIPFENIIDRLIQQLTSQDNELVCVTVSALALLGRGGISDIDYMICIEHGAIDALVPLLSKYSHQPRDKNCIYIVQALAWLSSSDTDIKIEMMKNQVMIESLARLIKQNFDATVKNLSIIILGNICQNPEIWGRPQVYDTLTQIVKTLTNSPYMIVDLLVDLFSNQNLEIQYNAIVTLTQTLGFKAARERFDFLGGEMILFDLVSASHSIIRDQASKSIRFYRTLQDYGDRMGDILLPKFRLNHSQQQQQQRALNAMSTNIDQRTIVERKNNAKSNNKVVNNGKTATNITSKENQEYNFHLTNLLADLDEQDNKKGVSPKKGKNKQKKTLEQQPSAAVKKSKKKEKAKQAIKQNETPVKQVSSLTDEERSSTISNGDDGVTSTVEQEPLKEKRDQDLYRIFITEFEKGMINLAYNLDWGD